MIAAFLSEDGSRVLRSELFLDGFSGGGDLRSLDRRSIVLWG